MDRAQNLSGRLRGKVVLVTGGGNGIGRAVCKLFADEGARIAIVDISKNAAEETLRLLESDVHCSIEGDVSKTADVEEAFRVAEERLGKKCDIVVNNAGIVGKQQTVNDISDENFDKVVDVNLKGIFLVAKHYLNSVKDVEADVRGVLINTSSMAGKNGMVFNGEYAAAKAGVVALTKTIANEFGVHRVRCNAVRPGYTVTSMTTALSKDLSDAIQRRIPLQRCATPDEMAYGFLFLASEESSYVHGTCLEISGGL